MVLLYRNGVLMGYAKTVKKAKEYLWDKLTKEGFELYPQEHYKNVNEWWDAKCRLTNIPYIYKFVEVKKLNIEG